MFRIKYQLSPSPIHGIGVFAAEDIPANTVIFICRFLLDLRWNAAAFEQLPPEEQQLFRHYGYWDEGNQVWHMDAGDSRFINHSDEPTMKLSEIRSTGQPCLIATRDIPAGTELTQDYRDFETEEALRRRGITV